MKEIMKSKAMVGFVIFILSISYISGVNTKRMEETISTSTNDVVYAETK